MSDFQSPRQQIFFHLDPVLREDQRVFFLLSRNQLEQSSWVTNTSQSPNNVLSNVLINSSGYRSTNAFCETVIIFSLNRYN